MIRGKHWNDGWLTAYWGRESRGHRQNALNYRAEISKCSLHDVNSKAPASR